MRFLYDSDVRALLKRHSIRPNKDRGQSFLTSLSVAHDIINAAQLTEQDRVLEIGGGLGILSDIIAKEVEYLYVVEIDAGLIRILAEHLDEYSNVTLIHGDALSVDLPNITKIVANLPYNVASEITFRLLKELSFESAIMMFQREFANRLLALPGSSDYSRLSIDFQYMGVAEHKMDVEASLFYPVPKVDSTVLEIRKRQEGVFAKDSQVFFWMVHGIYSYPNKQLKKALRIWFKLMKCADEVDLVINHIQQSIDTSTRLRSLRLSDLVQLADLLLEMIVDGKLPDPRR